MQASVITRLLKRNGLTKSEFVRSGVVRGYGYNTDGFVCSKRTNKEIVDVRILRRHDNEDTRKAIRDDINKVITICASAGYDVRLAGSGVEVRMKEQ